MQERLSRARLGSVMVALASGLLAAFGGSAALAQGVLKPEQEYAKFVERSKAITPMTEFGEQVNPRDGGLVVRATDLELKGTGPTIRITRSFNPNRVIEYYRETSGNGFGDWELEIPRIKTITSNTQGVGVGSPIGWQVSGSTPEYKNQRCTNFSAPGRIAFPTDRARSWNPSEWWDGYNVVDDAGSAQPLMSRTDSSVRPELKLMTTANWLVGCLSATTSGEPGEAFYAVAPDGTKYWFNHLVYTGADTLQKPLWTNAPPGLQAGDDATKSIKAGGGTTPQIIAFDDQLERRYASMLVTRIEDRFGNWITYNYNAGRLSSIEASDGRHVGVTFDSNGRISVITAGSGSATQTWNYSYPNTAGIASMVVTRPDQSTWQYSLPLLLASSLNVVGNVSSCTLSPNDLEVSASGTITSPAGATLTLNFVRKRFARSYVPKECWGGDPTTPDTGSAVYPREWYAWAMGSRTVTGPGLPSMTWTYTYAAPESSWYQECPTPTSCPSTTWTDITDPQGDRHRSIFSTKFDETENKMLRDEMYSSSGQLLRATDHAYATVANNAANPYPWPTSVGNDKRNRVNPLTRGQWAPERQTVTVQDGVSFTKTVDTFDAYSHPASVTRGSSLGFSRTETTTYADNINLWMLGQVQSVTSGGLVSVLNTYDSSTAQLLSSTKFGVLEGSYTWYADGTLHTRADGAGHTTTYANWYRGLPQSVSYPNSTSETAVANELGQITSHTGTHGYTSTYGYDAMGRLASITPPSGWSATSVVFEPVSGGEFGLPAGHWRQTITRGNAKTVTYMDGWWRPVMTRVFDAGDELNTRKVTVKAYDFNGKPSYESYPARDISAYDSTPYGTRTSYDALGRITQVDADSELGTLTTHTDYLSGFQTQVTNPRGYISTQSFWVLDNPGEAQLASAVLAQGTPRQATVNIARDTWGKPTSITRSGSYGGSNVSVTRSYVYDDGQRLCKTLEPEVIATVQDYDLAGNVKWRAPGVNLPNNACDTASVAASAKISYGYTVLNQLQTVSYGDGSPGITTTYTPDGLQQTVATDRPNANTWTYHYNSARLLDQETLTYRSQNYAFVRGYTTDGLASSLNYPDGSSIAFAPNALGEPSQVGTTATTYANAVSFHPNGAVAGFTFGNGIVHQLTQNTRGLPLVNQDGTVLQDAYTYDASANIKRIEDQRASPADGSFTRDMGYDELDRLISANAPNAWGNATYSYDPVDNLRTATVGARNSTLNYNTGNLLASLVTINGGNSGTANYLYDARGNISTKGGQTYQFDLGNRLKSASLGGSYTYDGLGRRIEVLGSDGYPRLQVYSQAGQLLWAEATSSGTVPAQANPSCSSGTLVNGQCVSTSTYGATPGYGCNAGDTLSGTTCTHVTTSTYTGTAGYQCNAGDTLSDGTCTHTATNTYGASVTGYSCNAGDTLSGSICTHTTSGTYAGTPTGYSCNAGDTLSGSTCTHNTSNTYGGTPTGYSCNAGDSLSGSTCTHTTSNTYGGTPTGYSCNAGDSLSGGTCTHTTSNTYGGTPTSYSCNAGDSLSGSTCTHTTSNTYGGTPTGYSCNSGDSLSGSTCTHTSYAAATPSYSCPAGYTLSGTTCSTTVTTGATPSYDCSTLGLPVAYAGGPGGYACTEQILANNSSLAQQACQDGAVSYGLSLIKTQFNAGKSYTCIYAPRVTYSCPSGGTLSGNQCVANSSQAASVSYSCSSGTLSGSQCVSTSTYGGAVTGYSCTAGDSLSGGTCTHTTSSDYGGTVTGYSCTAGDSLSGSTCTHTTSSNYGGTATGYSCTAGDSLSGNTCTHTTSSNYGGSATGYSCTAGDSLSGSTCTHITSSNYGGAVTAYSCNAGDSLNGSTCTHTTSGTYAGTVTGYSCTAGDSLSGSTCTHTTSGTYAGTVTGYTCTAGDSLSGSTCTHTASGTYAATVTAYTCSGSDSLSGSTCTHSTYTSPTMTYSCPNGGTLSGQQCTGLGTMSKTAYVYLAGKQVAEVSSSGVVQYVHTDGLGSPVAHTSAGTSWTVVNRTKFEPYGFTAGGTKPGVATAGQSTTGSAIGFTGHVNDPDTDLVYMQQRYYDPIAGRFLSVDPIVTDANTGKGFGLYTYVDNNPYAKIDPDGRDPDRTFGIMVGLVMSKEAGEALAAGDRANPFSSHAISNGVGIGQGIRALANGEGLTAAAGVTLVARTASGKRVGDFTKKQKDDAKSRNADKNGGKMKCDGCNKGVENVKSEKGVPTPDNQAQVHHDPPIQNGGGRDSEAKVLCPECHKDEHRDK